MTASVTPICRSLLRPQIFLLSAVALLALNTRAADHSYYERFTDTLTNGQRGFLSDISLVDTNNSGPIITNAPISFKKFQVDGEFSGVKLGMTMSEVVAAWGKPRSLFTHCSIGPRFWYGGAGHFGTLSLSFVGDRLVLIGISGNNAAQLIFDNSLTGQMGRAKCEELLGPPALRLRDPERQGLFIGEIAYRAGTILMELDFTSDRKAGTAASTEHLAFIAVRLEREAKIEKRGRKDTAP